MPVVSESSSNDLRRLNAEGRLFKKGDVREDGFIFRTYEKTKITKEGFYKESWLSPKAYENFQKCSRKAIDKHNARLAIERRELLDKIKMETGCIECGYKKHPVALDFDHIDPTKKEFTIGVSYASVSLKRLYKEIDKCQVLCANCHRIKTFQSRSKS
jgi:hypothetical protein